MFAKLRNLMPGRTGAESVEAVKSVDNGKLGYLESIRGLAACAVVLAHILAVYLPGVMLPNATGVIRNPVLGNLLFGLPLGFMTSGHFAVVLFFTLSGFVLTIKFFQSNNRQDLHRQAAKRFFRLAIPIFVVIMVAHFMLVSGFMAHASRVFELTGSPEVARNYNFTSTLSDAFHAATVGVIAQNEVKLDPVLWTMPIEFFGSFIVFGLAAFIVKVRRRWLIYGGAIILLGNSYYICFILGMLLADIVQNTNFIDYVRKRVNAVYYAAAILPVWIAASFPTPGDGLNGTIYASFSIPGADINYIYTLTQFAGAFLLLALVLVSVRLQKILNSRFLIFLGGISFAVYLVHYLILYSAGHLVYVHAREVFGLSMSAVMAGGVTMAITLIVAVFWKRYVDDLSVRVSRTFAAYILK